MNDDVTSESDPSQRRQSIDAGALQCPVPIQDYANVILGHGGGGKLSSELVQQVFAPAMKNDLLDTLADAAIVNIADHTLAMSTDSYVVRPLFFPGGSIGDLAVNGTVNDLAMRGAQPLYLSAGFIIEEGFPIADLKRIADGMGEAARRAGVAIITGDTKVVERGHGDGCYINTAGVGLVPKGIAIAPTAARTGDVVILSGTIGDHGMAIMSVREGLEFEAEIKSDSAPLAAMVAAIIDACPDTHVLRDPTRGGIAATLNEIAAASRCGIQVDEAKVPVNPIVQSACEILGFDPFLLANEGKLVCMVPAEFADDVLATIKSDPFGVDAAIIGKVIDRHPGMVVAKTAIGASRVITVPIGEQLPRIC